MLQAGQELAHELVKIVAHRQGELQDFAIRLFHVAAFIKVEGNPHALPDGRGIPHAVFPRLVGRCRLAPLAAEPCI